MCVRGCECTCVCDCVVRVCTYVRGCTCVNVCARECVHACLSREGKEVCKQGRAGVNGREEASAGRGTSEGPGAGLQNESGRRFKIAE